MVSRKKMSVREIVEYVVISFLALCVLVVFSASFFFWGAILLSLQPKQKTKREIASPLPP